MKVKIKPLYENTIIPTKADKGSAGYDLYAQVGVLIEPHKTAKVSVGFAMELPEGTFGAIYARSGLATKKGLRPANAVGIVDSSYRGEVFVALHNDTDEWQEINAGDRIAQLIVTEYPQVNFDIVSELSETERGEGGFGHSGN